MRRGFYSKNLTRIESKICKEEQKQMLIIYLDARLYHETILLLQIWRRKRKKMDVVFKTTSRAFIFIDSEGSISLQTS